MFGSRVIHFLVLVLSEGSNYSKGYSFGMYHELILGQKISVLGSGHLDSQQPRRFK